MPKGGENCTNMTKILMCGQKYQKVDRIIQKWTEMPKGGQSCTNVHRYTKKADIILENHTFGLSKSVTRYSVGA